MTGEQNRRRWGTSKKTKHKTPTPIAEEKLSFMK
jgi:hypothetical protein